VNSNVAFSDRAHARARPVWIILLAALCLASGVAPAAGLELTGELVQGALIIGRVAPGTRVALDGRPIRVGEDGRFLLGFDRDAPPRMRLMLIYTGGGSELRTLEIRQRSYPVQRIDGLPERMVTPSREDLARIERETRLMEAARARTRATSALYLDGSFRWPVTGRISGTYGSQRILNNEPRRPHAGVDIVAPLGTPVRAPAAGVVAFVHPDMFFNGATVLLDHGHGLTSTYVHLHRILVRENQWVDRGEIIGEVGASGRATGPHLHWGVDWYQSRLDPQLLAGPMPGS
jgi:murein DD-endopeptidase MepM/ murein hydrolase activator NlpD